MQVERKRAEPVGRKGTKRSQCPFENSFICAWRIDSQAIGFDGQLLLRRWQFSQRRYGRY